MTSPTVKEFLGESALPGSIDYSPKSFVAGLADLIKGAEPTAVPRGKQGFKTPDGRILQFKSSAISVRPAELVADKQDVLLELRTFYHQDVSVENVAAIAYAIALFAGKLEDYAEIKSHLGRLASKKSMTSRTFNSYVDELVDWAKSTHPRPGHAQIYSKALELVASEKQAARLAYDVYWKLQMVAMATQTGALPR